MRKTWSHLMISDIFYFIVDDTVFFPKDGKTYCPLTNLYSGNPLYPQKAKSLSPISLSRHHWTSFKVLAFSLLSLDIPLFSRLSP